MKRLLALFIVAGCEPAVTPEGCTIYVTDMMRPYTEACVAAHRSAKAKSQGKSVTRCYPAGSEIVCVSE